MSDSQAQERDPARDADPAGGASGESAAGESALREQVRVRQLARLGALFAGFAHEIRNPLSTIGLNLQLVTEDVAGSDTPRDQRVLRRLAVVEGEVRRLQAILEQFLGFVRIPELRLGDVDLGGMLRDVVEFVQPEMADRGVSLRFFGDPAVGHVRLDRDQFRAVLVNLLRNALDACEPGDEVMVSTRNGGDRVTVSVTDTGAGMPPDVRDKAFSPYFSTKKHGTGLGLPTARRIIEQHGGEIQLDSEVGRGTVFTIRLPREPKPSAERSGGAA